MLGLTTLRLAPEISSSIRWLDATEPGANTSLKGRIIPAGTLFEVSSDIRASTLLSIEAFS